MLGTESSSLAFLPRTAGWVSKSISKTSSLAPLAEKGRLMSITNLHLSREDDHYIRSRFVSLDWIATRSGVSEAVLAAWQRESLFPQPTYFTEDGKQWYSRAYVDLVRRAVAHETDLKSLFSAEYARALERLRKTAPADYAAEIATSSGAGSSPQEALESNWKGFLSGEYGVCLRVPWVPCMLRKGRLMRTIEELISEPRTGELEWSRRLHQSVDSLSRLEMPFTQWDRIRFGKLVSRDTHIEAVRQRFPGVFDSTTRSVRDPSRPTEPEVPGDVPY